MSTTAFLPLISVIIPCYNQSHFLTDAVNSIKSQTYESWECIIVNDGSTDNTEAIAKELAKTDNRIHVISQENKGLSGARNTGVLHAKGCMIQFLDADDILEKEKIKIQSDFLTKNKDIDIVFSDARYFTRDNPNLRNVGPYAKNPNKPWIVDLWHSPGSLLEKIINHNLFPVNCPLIKKTVFDKVGLWNEELDALEDWEFWIRCVIQEVKIEYHNSNNTLALICMHSASMTQDKVRIDNADFKMRKSIGPLIKDKDIKFINFMKGFRYLKTINARSVYYEIIHLFLAHKSLKSLYFTIVFFIKKII
jgi:glycosyltransferase involved in cell wall biosynthesis